MKVRRNQKGFTLIELLIVVAIIGIIAAIAIPNLLNAIDRGKQKRTMADMRSLGTSVEEYSIDNNVYPVAGDVATLAAEVEPNYIRVAPRSDGWGTDFFVASVAGIYTLGSCGKGAASCGSVSGTGATQTFDADIIFSQGVFIAWPEGQQN